ncbi:MAG: type II toxin-antitoxin system HicB family antitoxin [Bacillota bacterium]|nr:type II toxin-antitoxin system HicB family antitoxin [Bacillota bacterium]MDO5440263.1 type II toxin-antitoxin system HicB family antitoxin [Erysipelotrichaceae bacterium]
MSNIKYPAVFHYEDSEFWVEFPDLNGCFSSGKTLEEAYDNAKEALGIYLDKSNDIENRVINKPSKSCNIVTDHDCMIMFVEYDSIEYAKKYKNKAIKKTLSIPEWLNDEAIKRNINFSNILQDALLKAIKE